MRFNLSSPLRLSIMAILCVLFAFTAFSASAKDSKFEAQLVWATMSEISPDPAHKPVNDETRKKLGELPLKWKNYFLVKQSDLSVPEKSSKDVTLSDKCKIAVKDIDGGKNFEVALFGKGESVLKRTQKLPKGEMFVLGGNAPDSTGWLVVLKRIE
ncbi:MAG: hypothetical protein H7Y43_06730 [Akkermansiaceae bacterium]|nr:hypothetical protein [Verrucomicrobiales bacterium]